LGEEREIWGFGEVREHFQDTDVDGRIILKCILK
jgi:hypothetical protein